MIDIPLNRALVAGVEGRRCHADRPALPAALFLLGIAFALLAVVV